MVETLKEIASQQQTQTDASGHVLATFLEMDFNQDSKYIASQIQATLSAFGIDSNIAPKGLYDEAFFLDLPNVSLEYISKGPFQLANLIQSGYGLLTAFPLFESSNESIGSKKKTDTRSSGGGEDNVCDQSRNEEWHLERMKVKDAWKYSSQKGRPSKGKGIVIAQIDSGYSSHQCFVNGGMWKDPSKRGFNTFAGENEDDPRDLFKKDNLSFAAPFLYPGHGTVVGSLPTNRGNITVSRGVDGEKATSPQGSAPNATLYSIRAINDPAMMAPDIKRITKAFKKIVDDTIDVHVVSMSLGHYAIASRDNLSKDLSNAICDAQNKQNVIVVAAGGQSSSWIPNWTGAGGVMYPANFDHVIAIGGYQSTEYPSNDTALHKKRMQWYPSGHYGPGIDVTGPAKYICTSQVIVKKH